MVHKWKKEATNYFRSLSLIFKNYKSEANIQKGMFAHRPKLFTNIFTLLDSKDYRTIVPSQTNIFRWNNDISNSFQIQLPDGFFLSYFNWF